MSLLSILFVGLAAVGAPLQLDTAAADAVRGAVRARMGVDADVFIDRILGVPSPGGEVLDAVVGPGGKLGAPTLFLLRSPRDSAAGRVLSPTGVATLVVRVTVDHAHTSRLVHRGELLAAGDVSLVRHVIARGPLKPLPTPETAVGAKALRELPEGTCLQAQMLAAQRAVGAGADVVAILRTGDVEVRADLVALDGGEPGDRIRVLNPQSRRMFRARVVSRGLVEIRHD